MQNLSLDKQLEIFINEAIDKRLFISIVFAVVSVAVLLLGAYWPKIYESRTSILWTNYNPTSSILQQRVSSDNQRVRIQDQIEIAKEIIFSHKSMDKLIYQAQLNVKEDGNQFDKRELEILKGNIRSRMQISNSGTRLIEIAYRHQNPETAYLIVSIVSELFIQETRDVKNQSSQGAYDFIDRQVQDYKNKLGQINKRIIDFRKSNVDLDSDTRTGVNNRVNNLKGIIRQTSLQLTEARVQKKSLEEQLVIEKVNIEQQLRAESLQASTAERQSVNSERLSALQSNLDTLRLSYTESYPDIIQLKEQIKNLKLQIEQEKLDKQASEDSSSPQQKIDINFVESPLYSRLSGEIADAETLIQTLEARIVDTNERLDKELLRANKVNTLESQLEEMTRDLDVTQQIYDDLLTRRENARVSLNLQLENQGSTFKIQEPAVIPLVPTGLRFLHFALACIPVGLGVSLGLIYIYLFLDPRIRHEDSLDPEILNIPVIGTVDHYANDADIRMKKRKNLMTLVIISLAIVMLAAIAMLRTNQLIGI